MRTLRGLWNKDFRDSKEWVKKDFDSIQTKFSLNPHLLNQDYKDY